MKGDRAQAQAASLNSIIGRWQYLPRLVYLLWQLGSRETVLIGSVAAISGFIPLAALLVVRGLVDSTIALIAGEDQLNSAALWLSLLLLINLIEDLQWVVNDWINGNIRERVSARVEERLLAKASSLSLAAFERPDLYDQLHRARRALDERLFTAMSDLLRLISVTVTAIGALVYLATANPLFPIVLIVGLAPVNIVTLAVYRKVWILTRAQTGSERMLEYLSGLLTQRTAAAEVRLFGLAKYLRERRLTLASRLRLERMDLSREHFNRAGILISGEQIAYGVVIAGVLVQVMRGVLTIGQFAAYLAAAERLTRAMSWAGSSSMRIDSDLRYLADLIDYLAIDERNLLETSAGAGPASSLSQRPDVVSNRIAPTIRFSKVSFSYPGTNKLVIDHGDLSIEPGERVALVGRNGAGKSTVARLLLGLYQPTSGRITIDGTDLTELDPVEWRRRVSAVFQDYVRFELTARENIGFGDLLRVNDQPAIAAAAVKSGSAEFVAALPARYETVLGRAFDEKGQDISAGQWQRLASARAYIKDAPVLVLDEPTAALDAKAEVEVYRRFRDLSQGRSVLFISHRLGSARLADRIMFLEDGRIIEQGTHDELIALRGQYAKMYSIQAEWYR